MSVAIVGLDQQTREVVKAAVGATWPGGGAEERVSIDAALEARDATGILLADSLDASEIELAVEAKDAEGLPRWAVLVVGENGAANGAWPLRRAELDAAGVGHALKAAAAHRAAVRQAERARGDLWTIARRINHELRSPLGCILTSAEVLKEELPEVAPELVAGIQPITDSANELMQLVESLTFIARASAEKRTPVVLDTDEVVWRAMQRVERAVSQSGASIEEPESWPQAIGVAEWVERILVAYLQNALQHAGPAPAIEIGWREESGKVRFFVRDRGPGVPTEIRRSLFRPFNQLHLEGTIRGLGLPMVRRMCDLMGASCGFEDVEPTGACFHFSLPAAPTPDRLQFAVH